VRKIMLMFIFISGCNYGPDIKFGDVVQVTDGFYKNCLGIATKIWGPVPIIPCNESVWFDKIQCRGITKDIVYVSVCDVKVIK
jgi:hypothetical protein